MMGVVGGGGLGTCRGGGLGLGCGGRIGFGATAVKHNYIFDYMRGILGSRCLHD